MSLTAWVFRRSPKRTLLGVPTAVLFLTSDAERESVFTKVEEALSLIQQHAPGRFKQVRRDLACILVCGDASTAAQYVPGLRMCELFINYVMAAETSAANVASTLVHEATHARLNRLKVGTSAESHRIERACYHAERSFCRRLPDAGELVEAANAMMQADPATFSMAMRLERQIAALQRLDLPRWARAFGTMWLKRRTRAQQEGGRSRPTRG